MDNYCFEESGQALAKLKSSIRGLTRAEAAARLEKYGKNQLEQGKKTSLLGLFLSQFKDFMTILLIVAAAISGLIAFLAGEQGDLTDTCIILIIIFLNSAVGTVQQYRADKAIENLKKLSSNTCKVRRDGAEEIIPCEDITVGDIVLLEEGDVVPADCRIIECNNLACDESALTGESAAVAKNAQRIQDNKVSLGGMKNTLFGCTFVVRGNAAAAVTGVGMNTEIGNIAAMLAGEKASRTPLEKTLDKLGKIITLFVLAVTAVVFIIGMCVRSDGLLKNFMTSVAIAVAAIPEGLPAVVTIIMAMGVQKMSGKNVVIRRLKSVETLGGCSVICSDKTGTLTCNKLSVLCVKPDGEAQRAVQQRILTCMRVCNNVKGVRGNYMGDPTELALSVYADKFGQNENFKRLGELPFTSERKMMTVSAQTAEGKFNFTKGAPDVLIKKCARIFTPSGVRPLTDSDRDGILQANDGMSDEEMRVLGFAYSEYDGAPAEDNLIFLGLCGMSDVLKDGVRQAVDECRAAGIATVMITGDHARTALSIAKKLNIASSMDEVMTGEQLDALSLRERDKKIEKCRVFARVTPKHKNMIVKSLKRRGKVVAMTGDGINDAPSIKTADIGIAMGISGTDVTKSASDMVITDDNFTTIVAAVKEGRRISANIKKTIQFFLSTNLAEVLAILIASVFFFRFDFLLSTQLLWLNLITDSFPVLALGMEKGSDNLMNCPPERAEKSLFCKSSVALILFFGTYMTAAVIGVFALSLHLWGNETATTVTFMTISFLELFQAFNIRSERQSAFKGMFSNKVLVITVLAGIIINVILCVSPLAFAFSLTGMTAVQWVTVFAISFSVIPVGELYKLCVRKFRK